MAQRIVKDGLILEVQPDGTGKVVGYADSPAPNAGRIFSLPPSPDKVREQQRQDASDARANESLRLQKEAAARAQADFDSKNTMVPPPGDTTKTGEDYLATIPVSLAAQVKALSEGRRAFPTGAALRSPSVQELVAAASQYDPTLDAANAATRVATRKKFTSGTTRDNITAINTALGHLGTLYKDSQKLDNRGIPLWNTLANAAESASGDPRVSNFNMTKHAVVDELEKAFRGSGGTQAGIEQWSQAINSSQSPEQLRGAVGKAVELLNSRLEALGQAYEAGMGHSADPMVFLNPHARAVFNALGPGGDGNVPDAPKNFGGDPPILGGSDQPPPALPSAPTGGGPTDNGTFAPTNGKQRSTYDPRMSAQVDAMMNAGANLATINAVLKRQNFAPLSAKSFGDAKAWMTTNPGQKYFGANISRNEDLNLGQRVLANPTIAPIAAGLARAGDSASAGLLGAVSGEEGRGALEAAGELHPIASTIGDVGGAVAGAYGGEALAANALRAVPQALRYAPTLGDMAYSGTLGFNRAQPGEGGMGALEGAAAGLGGNLLMRGAGRALRGVTDPAVQFLRSRGIPLTVGQTVANSGPLGATIKNVEDALTSVPGVNAMVNARRLEGIRGFNRAAMEAGGAPAGVPVTETGGAGIQQLRTGIGDAYDNALGGTRINVNDPTFLADMQGLLTAANRLPPVNGAREAATSALESRIGDAVDPLTETMAGRNFQESYRGLARTGRERANGDYGHEIGQVMRQGQDVLAGALERQNPGAFEAFRAANATNRNANVLAKAVESAKNQTGELFTPAQLNMADSTSARRLSGPLASAAGDRPFYDLARYGQSVLPSKLPDSGTATRRFVAMGLTGAGAGGGVGALTGDAQTGAETGLGLTLLLAAGGSRPAQRAMVNLLADRPDAFRRAGDALYNNGWLGSGVLTPMLTGQ